MGGSEEAVYYISVEFAKLGHVVHIFGDPSAADVGLIEDYPCEGVPDIGLTCAGRVVWEHHSSFDIDARYDVFIAWRYALSLSLGKGARRSYLWLHDLIPAASLPKSFFNISNGIIVQSKFHQEFVRSLFLSMDHSNYTMERGLAELTPSHIDVNKLPIHIVPNGICNEQMLDGPNLKHEFIYGSAPNRGLQWVLESWSLIKEQVPAAILRVYYGFTAAVEERMRQTMGEDNYSAWFSHMSALLSQEGVEYHGAVNHSELTEAYRKAGFFLYPTDFQETGCISVLRAMACGCIPITSRLRESVLENLTAPFDMGPAVPLTREDAKDKSSVRHWAKTLWTRSVIDAYLADDEQLRERRERMKLLIRGEYSWKKAAETILLLQGD